jgi:hypothetical protein
MCAAPIIAIFQYLYPHISKFPILEKQTNKIELSVQEGARTVSKRKNKHIVTSRPPRC